MRTLNIKAKYLARTLAAYRGVGVESVTLRGRSSPIVKLGSLRVVGCDSVRTTRKANMFQDAVANVLGVRISTPWDTIEIPNEYHFSRTRRDHSFLLSLSEYSKTKRVQLTKIYNAISEEG